ncbi:Flp pilus assembly protein CpaB [Henriciella sp. AS95]|uniref:Flp pilus assembly protein CpaB n=1 Tax=Henriciella sp. AS95 TaxID=3135782 RepID=UPI00317523B2
MQLSPVVTMAISGACGLAAIVGAKVFIQPSSNEAEPISYAPAEVQKQDVVVAVRHIPRGVRLEEDWFEVVSRPVPEIPPGSVSDLEAFRDKSEGRLTLIELASGDILSEKMLLSEGLRGSLSAKIKPGLRAYSVRTNDQSGVGGFVLPGDRVDVILYRSPDDGRAYLDQQKTSQGVVQPMAEVLLQNVEVLGVDLNDDMVENRPSVFKTATLAVTLEQAQQLSVAIELGELSLALRGSADEDFLEAEAVSLGKDEKPKPVVRAPSGPKPLARRASTSSTVEVILGDETSSHTVPTSEQ